MKTFKWKHMNCSHCTEGSIFKSYIKHNWLLIANKKRPYKWCILEFWGCVISSFRNFTDTTTPHHPEQYWWTCHATQQRKKEDIQSFNATSCMEGEHNMLPTIHKNSLWPACISQIIAVFLKHIHRCANK